MRRLALILAILAAACSANPSAPTDPTTATTGTAPPGRTGRVESVIDGDSLRIVLDGISTEVRLLGINAPEHDECWADESGAALQDLVAGRLLTVVGDDRDQYGRLLAYVYAGSDNTNLALVATGAALAIASDHDLLPEFLVAEDDAVRLERGLWSPTACGPRIEHEITIWVVEPDAPGRDDTNPNGEFVAITNSGDQIDLTGWTIRDESSVHRYSFPDGFTLARGDIVTIRSGCGNDDPPNLYWCADGTVWTNSGDTVLLLEPSGAIADRERYFG